jgi:hypothetical protein
MKFQQSSVEHRNAFKKFVSQKNVTNIHRPLSLIDTEIMILS